MTVNKPEVVAFVDKTQGWGKRFASLKQRVDIQALKNGDELIRLSDYEALHAECENLRRLLRRCEPVLIAHAGASHLTDGFRPRRNAWDELVEQIDAALLGGRP